MTHFLATKMFYKTTKSEHILHFHCKHPSLHQSTMVYVHGQLPAQEK